MKKLFGKLNSRTIYTILGVLLSGLVLATLGTLPTANAKLTALERQKLRVVGSQSFAQHLGDLLDPIDNAPATLNYSLGTLTSNHIDVTLKMFDGRGARLTLGGPVRTYCYASNNSNGRGFVTTAGTSAFSAPTDGSVDSISSGKSAIALTNSAGTVTVRVTQTSGTSPTQYLCCEMPHNRLQCTGAMAFH